MWAVVLLTLVAAFLRLWRLRFGYAHAVVGYDEGVYFGSSLSLTEGRLPYRDYVLVHPPAITLVFLPFALLAKVIGTAQAMGLAKIATALAGAASVPLAARLLWHRGLPAVLLACGAVAFQDDAVTSGYAPLLEPWVVLFCLIGVTLVFRGDRLDTSRHLWWGGAVLGIACATKIWAFAVVLAVMVVCLPARRRVTGYLSGVAVGFLVPVLPFAVLAPTSFVHEVFVVQLLRTTAERTTAQYRLLHLFSVGPPNANLPTAGRAWLTAAALVVALLLVAAWVPLVRRATALERFAVLSAVLVVGMLFVPGTFYWHYAAFAAPFLAIAAVLPLTTLRTPARRAWTVVLALCVLALVGTMVHRDLRHYGLHDEHAAFGAAVPAGACIVTTQSTSVIADDRYLSGADCPGVLDAFGTALAYSGGRSPAATTLEHPELVALWIDAVRHADYVYLVRRVTPTVPPDPALHRYLAAHFHLVDVAGLAGPLYARN